MPMGRCTSSVPSALVAFGSLEPLVRRVNLHSAFGRLNAAYALNRPFEGHGQIHCARLCTGTISRTRRFFAVSHCVTHNSQIPNESAKCDFACHMRRRGIQKATSHRQLANAAFYTVCKRQGVYWRRRLSDFFAVVCGLEVRANTRPIVNTAFCWNQMSSNERLL